MTAEADLDRRVTRVENETVHIYNLIDERTAAIQATLDEHAQRLDEHGRILDEHGRILNEHGRILNEHGRILNEHTERFDQVDRSLAEILRRLPEPN